MKWSINILLCIITFCNGRGLNAGLHITIKGKISQNDAADLIKYLKEKYNYKIDFSTWYPVSKNEFIPLKRSNIQETIADFFNNK